MNRTCPVDESEFRASAASLSAMTGVPIIVQKYGGTSVADTDRITRVADRIARTKRAGNNVVVAVSAMGKTTDQLIRQAEEISPHPPGREMDMLLTAGERISMALLAMAIQEEGLSARSFTGSQAGIITDDVHGKAKILEASLQEIADMIPGARLKGRGMMRGVDVGSGELAEAICGHAFKKGLIIETSGADDEVVKVLAALTIPEETFRKGLGILVEAASAALADKSNLAAE